MVRDRLSRWKERAITELRRSFSETHTPHEIAASFAIGVFITMLPTLGTGLLVFILLIAITDRINRIALFASVIVLNPVVKWGVYAASITLGFLLLGPVDGTIEGGVSLDTGTDVIVRLLLGNMILAVIATAIAYVAVHRLASRYQEQAREVIDTVIEEVEQDIFPEQ